MLFLDSFKEEETDFKRRSVRAKWYHKNKIELDSARIKLIEKDDSVNLRPTLREMLFHFILFS